MIVIAVYRITGSQIWNFYSSTSYQKKGGGRYVLFRGWATLKRLTRGHVVLGSSNTYLGIVILAYLAYIYIHREGAL